MRSLKVAEIHAATSPTKLSIESLPNAKKIFSQTEKPTVNNLNYAFDVVVMVVTYTRYNFIGTFHARLKDGVT